MLSEDLISFLTLSGFNVFPEEGFIPADISESKLPCVFVYGTGGYAPHDYIPLDRPTYQIIVKGKSYKDNPTNKAATEKEAKRLISLLHRKHNYNAGNTYVWSSKATQTNPIALGLDEKDRPMYSTNFVFQVKGV